jgi:hypothetical protein
MALPIIADTWRAAINWFNLGGQIAENVIHILAPGKTSSQVATALDTDIDPNMFLSVQVNAEAPTVSLTKLDGASATIDFPLTNWVGTAAGDWVPDVSALLTLETGVRGRSFRGRIYLPFTAENRVTDGLWTDPTNYPAQAAAWAEWMVDMSATGFDLVVASYKLAEATVIGAIVGHDAFATQRRRQGRLHP